MVEFIRHRKATIAAPAAAAGPAVPTGQVPIVERAMLSRRAFGFGAATLLGDAVIAAAGTAYLSPITAAADDRGSFVSSGQTPAMAGPRAPLPAGANSFRIGVYGPYATGRVSQFNTFIGRTVDFAEIHCARDSWINLEGSAGDQLVNVLSVGEQYEVRVCPPLFMADGQFSDVTSGANDAPIRKFARTVGSLCHPTKGKFKQSHVVLRIGQELNGHFQPWRISRDNVTIDHTLARANQVARRRWGLLLRQTETELGLPNGFFIFDLNLNFTSPVNNPEWWYPGDQYTDIISNDIYYNPQYSQPTTANEWFEFIRDSALSGMAWCKNFARSPAARPNVAGENPSGALLWGGIREFGIKTDGDTATFANVVPLIAAYLQANHAEGWGWWDEEGQDAGNYQSMVSNGHLPNIGAHVKAIFGRPTSSPPAVVSKFVGPTVPAYVPPASGSSRVLKKPLAVPLRE